MLPLAVIATKLTALETIKAVPTAFWVRLGLAVLAIVVAVFVLRRLAQTNKVVLAVVVIIAGSAIGFSWIYERNEPAWATPAVEKVAGFFPSKGSYATKQARP